MMQLFTKTSSCIKQVRSTRPITGSRLGSPRCISIYIPKTHFTSFFDKKRPYFGWLILQNRGHSSIYTPVETIYIYIYVYIYIYIHQFKKCSSTTRDVFHGPVRTGAVACASPHRKTRRKTGTNDLLVHVHAAKHHAMPPNQGMFVSMSVPAPIEPKYICLWTLFTTHVKKHM